MLTVKVMDGWNDAKQTGKFFLVQPRLETKDLLFMYCDQSNIDFVIVNLYCYCACSLSIRNIIDYFVYFLWRSNWYLNRMTILKTVQFKSTSMVTSNKMRPYVQTMVNAKIFDPRHESFIQPQMCPPLHCDKIA